MIQGPTPAFELPGTTVRAATRTDTDACTAICVQVHGHPRTAELEDAIDHGAARGIARGGRVTGYTTGVGFIGHSVAESNADLQALIAAADGYFGPGFHVPTSNGALVAWCLQNGLRITKLMSLMTVGMYHTPRGAFLPSVVY